MADMKEIVCGAAAVVGAGIAFGAYLAAPPRYAITHTGNGVAYRLDRHSGEMSLCFGLQCRKIEEVEPQAQERTPDMNATDGENPAWRQCVDAAKDAVEAANCSALK